MRYILSVSKTSTLVKETFPYENYDIRAEDIGYGPYSGLAWMDRSGIVIKQYYDNNENPSIIPKQVEPPTLSSS